eukprot:s1837_g4.t1
MQVQCLKAACMRCRRNQKKACDLSEVLAKALAAQEIWFGQYDALELKLHAAVEENKALQQQLRQHQVQAGLKLVILCSRAGAGHAFWFNGSSGWHGCAHGLSNGNAVNSVFAGTVGAIPGDAQAQQAQAQAQAAAVAPEVRILPLCPADIPTFEEEESVEVGSQASGLPTLLRKRWNSWRSCRKAKWVYLVYFFSKTVEIAALQYYHADAIKNAVIWAGGPKWTLRLSRWWLWLDLYRTY